MSHDYEPGIDASYEDLEVIIEDLEQNEEKLRDRIAALEKENYKLKMQVHEEDGLEKAMARNGYGSVSKPPRRRQ